MNYYKDLDKVRKCIESINDSKQCSTCINLVEAFYRKWKNSSPDDELEHKCANMHAALLDMSF